MANTAAAGDMSLPCPDAGSQQIGLGKVTFDLHDRFAKRRGGVKLLFLRPALKKADAVAAYRTMIEGFTSKVPHWQLFALKQDNPERIVLTSYHEIATRISGPKNALFDRLRFFQVAFEPEDATAEFIRAVAPSSYLIVIARQAYATSRPRALRHADMAITLGDAPLAVPGSNGFSVERAEDIAPLLRNWIEGWIFGRNRALVPMFGATDDLGTIRDALTGPAGKAPRETAELVLLQRPATGIPADRVCAHIRDTLSERVEAAYLSLAMRHKYWGILQNPHMTPPEQVSWLLRAGLYAQFLTKEV